MEIGYIRVSAADQNLDRQREKLLALGIEERFIFADKASGKNFDRPQYQAMRQVLREGDLLYIDALDRLGRNYDGVISEWKYITREIKADIVVLNNQELFDSRKFRQMGELGKLMEDQFLSLLAYIAEMERSNIKQRQREGITIALKEKRPYGRPKIAMTPFMAETYNRWAQGEITAVKAMKIMGLKRGTFYNLAKKIRSGKPLSH